MLALNSASTLRSINLAIAVLIGLLVLTTADLARAQQSAAPSPTVATEDLRALASTLEDQKKREELLTSLRALIAAQEQAADQKPKALGDRILSIAVSTVREAQDAMSEVAQYFRDWPVLFAWLKREWSDPAARARGAQEGLAFIALFAAGSFGEWLAWALLGTARRRLDSIGADAGRIRLGAMIGRTVIDLLPLLAFAAAAYATALVIDPTPKVRAVGLNFVNAYLVGRGLMAIARLLLAPTAPGLRLLPLADLQARDVFTWTRHFVVVGVSGYFIIAAAILLGLPLRGADALLHLLGVILSILAVLFVLRHRRAVKRWLHRQASSASSLLGAAQLLRILAATWHMLAIAYIVGFLMISTFDIKDGFRLMFRGTAWSLAVVVLAWLLTYGLGHLSAALKQETAEGSRTSLLSRLSSYLPALSTALRVVIFAIAAVLVLEVWGIGAIQWFIRPSGQRMLSALVSIGLVVAFSILVWEVASGAIERYLTSPHRDGTPIQRSARARTLLPLMRKALFIFLSIMVVLITLSELGIDIAPLLAGAGVIGLAIGVGAQKLVQDVITGVFILVEDAISVGDVVNVAGIGGVVEDMSIRSIRLRDLSGTVNTIPFSSVDTVTNMTKDFSYAVLDVGVAYRESIDSVAQVCRDVVEAMRRDPQFSVDILEPLEVLGVDQFADSAVILKARIKTRPSRQWAVTRDFNGRLKKRFDELGIEIPFPQRTVNLGLDAAPAAIRVQLDKPEELAAALRSLIPGEAAPLASAQSPSTAAVATADVSSAAEGTPPPALSTPRREDDSSNSKQAPARSSSPDLRRSSANALKFTPNQE